MSVYNGSTTNGSVYNGSVYNGSIYNGSVYNGSVYNGSTTNGSVNNGSVTNCPCIAYLVAEPGKLALLRGAVHRALLQVALQVLLNARVGRGERACRHGHQLPAPLVHHAVGV